MQDRTVVWSNPEVQRALFGFITVAVDVNALTASPTQAGEAFREIASAGHYGAAAMSRTAQGTYIVSPGGKLIASGNQQNASIMTAMLNKARREHHLPSRADSASNSSKDPVSHSPSPLFTTDGLAFRVTTRKFFPRALSDQPLPTSTLAQAGLPSRLQRYLADKPETYWEVPLNQDTAWLTDAEARQFLPPTFTLGESHAVPAPLVKRWAQLHLLDPVRALGQPFPDEAVKAATLTSQTHHQNGSLTEIRFTGTVHLHQQDYDSTAPTHDRTTFLPKTKERRYDASLLGRAIFDQTTQKFTSFELIALGQKSGGSRLSRFDEVTMGVLFQLDPAAASVVPRYHSLYALAERDRSTPTSPSPRKISTDSSSQTSDPDHTTPRAKPDPK